MSAPAFSTLDAVRAWVAERRPGLLDLLREYVDCGGVSATGEGIAAAAAHAVALCEAAGLEAHLHDGERHPFLVARSPRDPAKPTVLVYGHYDVQPAGVEAEWESPPFAAEVRGDRIYGRGVVDNKGQHLAHLLALRALRETGGELPCNVVVLLDGEEEIGSAGMNDFVRAHAAELAADVAVWSDGPVADDDRPCVVYGVRGVVLFELHLQGARAQVHSGNWGGLAPNAAWALTWLLGSICGPDGVVTVDGFYDGSGAIRGADAEAIATFAPSEAEVLAQLGVRALPPPEGRSVAERLLAYPTFTINAIVTGEGELGARPIVPNRASAYCDVRLVPGQSADAVIDAIRRHLARRGGEVRMEVTGVMEPSSTAMDARYSAAVQAGVEIASGIAPRRIPALGGGLPLYAFTDILGVPCYGIPFANRDGANHSPNENFEIDRFLDGIVTSAAVLEHISIEHRGGVAG